MCVIAFKPKDVEPMSKETLEECFRCNSDGAGYSYWDKENKIWAINKGFMTFPSFWKAFKKEKFSKDDTFMAHFRIATSGNKDGGNTHPFPVCDNFNTMRKKENTAEDIAYHNGVVGGGGKIASDTMERIKECILPMHHHIGDGKYEKIMDMVCQASSNRWLITKGDDIYMYGNWEEHEGVFYSNNSYKIINYTTNTVNHVKGNWRDPKWPYNVYEKEHWDVYKKRKEAEKKTAKEEAKKDNKEKKNESKSMYDKYKERRAKREEEEKNKPELRKKDTPKKCPACEKKNVTKSYYYLGQREHSCSHCGAVFNDDLDIKLFEIE